MGFCTSLSINLGDLPEMEKKLLTIWTCTFLKPFSWSSGKFILPDRLKRTVNLLRKVKSKVLHDFQLKHFGPFIPSNNGQVRTKLVKSSGHGTVLTSA